MPKERYNVKLTVEADNADQMKSKLLRYIQGYSHQHLAVELMSGYEQWAAFGLMQKVLENQDDAYLPEDHILTFLWRDGHVVYELVGRPQSFHPDHNPEDEHCNCPSCR